MTVPFNVVLVGIPAQQIYPVYNHQRIYMYLWKVDFQDHSHASTLKMVGDMTEPWGTLVGHDSIKVMYHQG